jgi:uncharacterized protein
LTSVHAGENIPIIRDKKAVKDHMRVKCNNGIVAVFVALSICNLHQDILSSEHPDSLNILEKCRHGFNPAICAIKAWQSLSFRTSLIECQFEPCCSNYGIQAFERLSFHKGILYTADRVSRCHPFAGRYYPLENGGLADPFDLKCHYRKGRAPYVTIPVAFILPGFHKAVNGRFYDGVSMFIFTELAAFGAYRCYRGRNAMFYPISFLFLSFYFSDIYFNLLSLRDGE